MEHNLLKVARKAEKKAAEESGCRAPDCGVLKSVPSNRNLPILFDNGALTAVGAPVAAGGNSAGHACQSYCARAV